MTRKAYAKINIGLRILKKRQDGYHEIETVFHRINLFDEIAVVPSDSISLVSSHPTLPVDDNNICLRAAKRLQEHLGIQKGATISLVKNIPMGAGLGGGSSDAAATLLCLLSMWKVGITHESLLSIALELGSDVPYFLKEGSAYATGRGEKLEYFALEVPYWIVCAYPEIHISTAWAYSQTSVRPEKAETPLKQIILEKIRRPAELSGLIRNDFEPLILRTHEPVIIARQALYDSGAVFAQLSGSGSAVYGFFKGEAEALEAAGGFPEKHRIFITPPGFSPV